MEGGAIYFGYVSAFQAAFRNKKNLGNSNKLKKTVQILEGEVKLVGNDLLFLQNVADEGGALFLQVTSISSDSNRFASSMQQQGRGSHKYLSFPMTCRVVRSLQTSR